MAITIDLPDMNQQRLLLLRDGAERGREALRQNLNAPHFPAVPHLDVAAFGDKHLRTESEGWEAPVPELVNAWFSQFQETFQDYASEPKLAALLGLQGKQGDRRIRAFKSGDMPVPYGIWRHFLVITGRVSQEIIPVMGIFDMDTEQK
ncbi:TPA: hypothetical protein U5D73_004559 [Yersinia enterocolitica]|uniref:hypothetical protein n=1 Tax=Yersinia aleksiciae TaxID=263819 RepID=UPI0011A683FB|nr:hypothetical protein [Yersinia aleksiciae]HEN3452045.1 hypothetical protein [Yersinia enterocolitica]